MARLANAILPTGTGYANGHGAPMFDISLGGMNGFDLRMDQWVNNQNYVRKNLFCLLIEPPKGFALLRNPETWVSALRALVELHPMTIEGLNAGLTVETASNAVGGAGQVQEDYIDVKEEPSKPVFRWLEKYGMPVQKFLRAWITYLLMDPHSKYPNVITLADGVKPKEWTAEMYSATMMFIETDPTHTKVAKSWLVTNMFPLSDGGLTGRREMAAAGEVVTMDISFTGIAQYGFGVDKFAQELLDGISTVGANPQARAAFIDKIAADVLRAKEGYEAGTEQLGSTSVRL